MMTNSSSRERILSKVNKVSSQVQPAPLNIEPLPCEDHLAGLDNQTRFTTNAQAAASEVLFARSKSDALRKIFTFIDNEDIDSTITTGIQSLLIEPLGERIVFGINENAKISISEASFGIAETGSAVLFSGQETPTSINFLPDYQFLLLSSANILNSVADAFSEISKLSEGHQLPRAMNIISGPSRTADIEQTLQLGAHGPKRLIIVLIDNEKHK